MADLQHPGKNQVAFSRETKFERYSNSLFLKLVIVVLLLGTIIIVLFVTGALSPSNFFNSRIATIGSKGITKKDVEQDIHNKWGPYAGKVLNDTKLQNTATKKLIEDEILKQEAPKLGIAISDQEIQKEQDKIIKEIGKEKYNQLIIDPSVEKEKIRIKLLKEQVEKKVVYWKLIEGITVFRDPNSTDYEKVKEELIKTLEKAREFLVQGRTLQETLDAVKGMKDLNTENVRVVSPTRAIKPLDGWSEEFKKEFFTLKKNDITKVMVNRGGAMFVGKIIDENNGAYESYDAWLKAMQKQYGIQ